MTRTSCGKCRVERALQSRRPRCVDVSDDARHLTGGMHARVGAASADDDDALPLDRHQRVLDVACTVRCAACRCQPAKSVPS